MGHCIQCIITNVGLYWLNRAAKHNNKLKHHNLYFCNPEHLSTFRLGLFWSPRLVVHVALRSARCVYSTRTCRSSHCLPMNHSKQMPSVSPAAVICTFNYLIETTLNYIFLTFKLIISAAISHAWKLHYNKSRGGVAQYINIEMELMSPMVNVEQSLLINRLRIKLNMLKNAGTTNDLFGGINLTRIRHLGD